MELPPGPVYLLRLLPHFIFPSACVYIVLQLSERVLPISFPLWFISTATFFAKPVLFILNKYYQEFMNKRKAAYNGAVLPPSLQEPTLSIVKKLSYSMQNGYPADAMQAWAEQYGNIYQFNLFTDSVVVTQEPAHIKAMLATQFESFEKGAMFKNQMNSLLGTGIFNVDGEMWKFHRSITRPFFSRERISDFEIYKRNCDLSLKEAQSRLAEGYSIDFQDLVSRFTLDSATEFLFGTNVGSLSAGIPYPPLAAKENSASFFNHPSNVFVNGFMEGQVRSALRYTMGAGWPLGSDFWANKVAPMRQIMDDFAEPLMNEALARRERRLAEENAAKHPDLEGEATNLLDHLVNHTQDQKTLKDELINLLVAGRDTTMCLLTFSFYMLCEHPEIERRLRQEIFETVGQTGNPTYGHMREMKYLRAFLNEVLRLYPPVPVNMRASKEPVVWRSGDPKEKPIYIPAGTLCYYTVINMHRRTDLWGPDALTFDPDRFLDARLAHITANPYIFCPFNAGPRICLGQQFAYHEATFYLVRLLQRFTGFALDRAQNVAPPAVWATSATGRKAEEKVHPMSHLTLYVKGGLWVTMRSFNEEAAR